MRHVAGDSLQPIKRAAQPIEGNFTWSGGNDPFWKPTLKTMMPSNIIEPVELSEQKNSPQQEVNDACPQQENLNRSGDIENKPASAFMNCNPETASADFSDRGGEDGEEEEKEEEDEDLSIFFTPELFDDDSEQGPMAPLQEEEVSQSEEALQEVRQVASSDGQAGVSDRDEALGHSWERKERQL